MKREEDTLLIDSLLVQEFKDTSEIHAPIFIIPEKFKHVDFLKVHQAQDGIMQLKSIIKSIHPWSPLHHGMTGLDMVLRLYLKTIPEYFGENRINLFLRHNILGAYVYFRFTIWNGFNRMVAEKIPCNVGNCC